MQQRTGVGEGGRRIRRTRDDIPVVYYVFDLLYLDGYNLMRVDLEKRKELLASILAPSDLCATPTITSAAARRCFAPRPSADWKASSPSAAEADTCKSAAANG